jgi:hypothetical protein
MVRLMTRRTMVGLAGGAWLALARSIGAADSPARASTPAVRKEIVAVIEGQLAAFRRGDVEKAYGFAAAPLRAQKPLPAFVAIVEGNYPEIWRNARAEFGIVRDNGTQATVTVQVYSKDADAAYDYTLSKERAGWRIHGVVRHAPKQKGRALKPVFFTRFLHFRPLCRRRPSGLVVGVGGGAGLANDAVVR